MQDDVAGNIEDIRKLNDVVQDHEESLEGLDALTKRISIVPSFFYPARLCIISSQSFILCGEPQHARCALES